MYDKVSNEKSDVGHLRRAAAQVAIVDTNVLLGGSREVVLLHKGEHYRLRVTQNGKLILTK